MSSQPSSAASWTARDGSRYHEIIWRRGRQTAPPQCHAHPPDVGDQRHAVRRRDAGAADRLHGDGASVDRRGARRSASNQGRPTHG